MTKPEIGRVGQKRTLSTNRTPVVQCLDFGVYGAKVACQIWPKAAVWGFGRPNACFRSEEAAEKGEAVTISPEGLHRR